MDEFKNSNNVESLTLLNVLREKLDGGIGAVVVRDVVLYLCAKDIVHFLFTSFFKQLKDGTIDILAIVKDHLRVMRSIYTLYPEPDFVRPEIYFAETNILLNACRDARVEDVKCIFTYNDQYLPYIRDLLSDAYRDCPKTVKDMLCYAFPVKRTMGKIDFNFYELKNVLHECICSYSERCDFEICEVQSDIIQYLFTHAPHKLRSFYSLPMDLILDRAPGRPNGSIVYVIDGRTGGCTAATLQQSARKLTIKRELQLSETGEDGGNTHLHIPWYPMQCVLQMTYLRLMYNPPQHIKWFIKYNPCSIPMLHLIYFSCYHWGMDYFYQCQPQFVERCVIDSIPKHVYMLKKMEATEKVGRKLFDAAKAAGILNNVFQLATRNMVHVVNTDVTLLDLYQIVFAEVKQVVALVVGRCTTDRRTWERCMQSYDEAVAAKFKQLRGEYGMRFFREY